VRRRGGDSRRFTRSSRTSPRAGTISKAAVRTRGAALATESDASHEARDAVDGIRDARRHVRGSAAARSTVERGADDTHGEAEKRAPTSTESSAVLARGPCAPPGEGDVRGGARGFQTYSCVGLEALSENSEQRQRSREGAPWRPRSSPRQSPHAVGHARRFCVADSRSASSVHRLATRTKVTDPFIRQNLRRFAGYRPPVAKRWRW
jgi:hypothetical protein